MIVGGIVRIVGQQVVKDNKHGLGAACAGLGRLVCEQSIRAGGERALSYPSAIGFENLYAISFLIPWKRFSASTNLSQSDLPYLCLPEPFLF